jgi:hypothetical protein
MLESIENIGAGAAFVGMGASSASAASKMSEVDTKIKGLDSDIENLENELKSPEGVVAKFSTKEEKIKLGQISRLKGERRDLQTAKDKIQHVQHASSSKRHSLQFFASAVTKPLEKQQEASATINSQAVSRQMDSAQSGLESVRQGNQQTKDQILQTEQRLAQAQIPLSQKG